MNKSIINDWDTAVKADGQWKHIKQGVITLSLNWCGWAWTSLKSEKIFKNEHL